jgi:hypothetical protein
MAACTPSIHVFLGRRLFLLSRGDFRGLVFGFLAFFCFLVMNEVLTRCINPQPGEPGDFWAKVSL